MGRTKAYNQARRAVEYLLDKKAQGVTLMDLRKSTDVADYFVVCHGDSDLHVRAIADSVIDRMAETGARAWHVEGMQAGRWVLVDYVDVVVHVFRREERDFYALERLWGDAKTTAFADDGRGALAD